MTRLMSVAETKAQVYDRTKTVTRRLGWWTDKNGRRLLHAGDQVTLCEKVQGRRYRCDCGECARDWRTDPLVRICDVDIIDVRREPLNQIELNPDDVTLEGFPDWTSYQFVAFFCDRFKVSSTQMVTRIEWRYLP